MFELDDQQRGKLGEWLVGHNVHAHGGEDPYCGAIGGQLTYSFSPTGLGIVTKVSCCLCEDKKAGSIDLTDYESW